MKDPKLLIRVRCKTRKFYLHKAPPGRGSDLDDFVACYKPKNRQERKEFERFKSFTHDELTKRDKLNLDIFWIKDRSLEDAESLPEPDVLAQEIAEDLQAAMEQFAAIAAELK